MSKTTTRNNEYGLVDTSVDFNSLRPIAQRQIKRLLCKIKASDQAYFTRYSDEISRVIEYEQERGYVGEK